MTTDVQIEKYNESYVVIYSDDEGILTHIYESFRFKKPGFVKNKWTKWDGIVRLFDKRTQRLPLGLLFYFLKFCQQNDYTFSLDKELQPPKETVSKRQLVEWIKGLSLESGGVPIEPYDYQLDSVYKALNLNRLTILAATSAGKSLIIYLLTRFYDEIGYDSGKTLIIVPSIGLVSQLYNDFIDYSTSNGWDVEGSVSKIAEGASRVSRKPIYISTWQSLQDMPPDYFHQFQRIIVDECHLASADSITKICNNSIYADVRIGMTGTLNGTELHELQVAGLFGPIKRVVTSKKLIEDGRATKTQINMLMLQYPKEDCYNVSFLNAVQEIDYLMEHEKRTKVIIGLAASLKGNCLFLFNRREKHLDKLYQMLVDLNLPNKKVVMIAGGVSGDEREAIKREMENTPDGIDIILLAIDRTTSTGWSVKRLHHLVFCFSTKSVITTLQSVGRMLRLHDTKEIANVWDMVDVLKWDGKNNASLERSLKRHQYYVNEGFPVKFHKIKF